MSIFIQALCSVHWAFPLSMFTAIFTMARTVGWIAQWNEMISDPDYKIGRPRQLYTGATNARCSARLHYASNPALPDSEVFSHDRSDTV